MILTSSGEVYTFGYGDSGQLGHKNTDNQKKPTFVADFKDVRIAEISAGNYHSIVKTEKGDLYGTGLNKDG
jgi:alpha-tubulin suppressor-like RCC1 family protein